MRELNLSSLTNIRHTASKAGSVRWHVSLFAEGLGKSGHIYGE
jgi:hypothetical protein